MNNPRSGIVPPEVTASRWAPGLPSSTPVTRSQVIRARSSPNSSLGYRPASMSSTADSASSGSAVNGAARRTVAATSATVRASTATIATSCCASTSSGLRGYRTASIAPAAMRSATTAHETRSPRNFGNITPLDVAPTWWPARPTRCSPDATVGGASTCTTRSTAPMSIPSSSDDVATTHGSRPDLSSSSVWVRWSRDIDPWCARAITGSAPVLAPDWAIASAGKVSPAVRSVRSAASSFSRAVSRSASRREFVNTIVDRCPRISSRTRSSTAGQMDARGAAPSPVSGTAGAGTSSSSLGNGGGSASPVSDPSAPSDRSDPGADRGASSAAMSSTGTSTRTSTVFGCSGCTTRTGLPPARNVPISSTGRTVADSPIRCAGASNSSSNRSSESARWAPRLLPAMACTSSTMTVSTPRSDSRADEVSSRNSDSGVVTRTSGGVRMNARRSAAVVSPVRVPTVISGGARPSRRADWDRPVSGARRLRCTSTASAFSGDTYSTRHRRVGVPGGVLVANRSSAHRNAASVLPEPVGATTSACSPACAARHAPSCAAVGSANAPANQSRVAGEKRSSTALSTPPSCVPR